MCPESVIICWLVVRCINGYVFTWQHRRKKKIEECQINQTPMPLPAKTQINVMTHGQNGANDASLSPYNPPYNLCFKMCFPARLKCHFISRNPALNECDVKACFFWRQYLTPSLWTSTPVPCLQGWNWDVRQGHREWAYKNKSERERHLNCHLQYYTAVETDMEACVLTSGPCHMFGCW